MVPYPLEVKSIQFHNLPQVHDHVDNLPLVLTLAILKVMPKSSLVSLSKEVFRMFSADSESMGLGSGITVDGDLFCCCQIWGGKYYYRSENLLDWAVELQEMVIECNMVGVILIGVYGVGDGTGIQSWGREF